MSIHLSFLDIWLFLVWDHLSEKFYKHAYTLCENMFLFFSGQYVGERLMDKMGNVHLISSERFKKYSSGLLVFFSISAAMMEIQLL